MTKFAVVGSGTGANYPIVAGAMTRLIENGLEISELIATSGSSLAFSFIAAGNTVSDFLSLAKKIGPEKIISKNWNIFQPGVFHLDKLQKQIEPYISKTFRSCKIPLTLIATDSDTGEEVIFSTSKTPDVSVALAVQATSSVPGLFRHVNWNNRRLVDGGVVNNFALDMPKEPTIGIKIYGSNDNMKPWKGWDTFITNMVGSMMHAIEKEHIEDGMWKKAKVIPIQSPISGMDFLKLNDEMIDKLYHIGYNIVGGLLASGWKYN